MYSIGDIIIYGGNGACRIEDIRTRSENGPDSERLYYILKPLYDECMISAPVDTTTVTIRPIISKGEAEALIGEIPNIKAEAFHSQAMRQLTEHYESVIKTYDCRELLEMTMSIYLKKKSAEEQNRKLGTIDARFMKRAEELLFGELAVALSIGRDEVTRYISAKIEE